VELGLLMGHMPKASRPACVENGGLFQGFWAELHMGCRNKVFEFIQDLGFETKDLNTFKLNLNLAQTKINLNKLFNDFSNLKLLKISLNIQIQTKALNGRLLNQFKKRFQNEI
jgi:hypothetical protein